MFPAVKRAHGRFALPGWKIKRQPFTAARDRQRSHKAGSKLDFGIRVIQMFKDDMRGGKRGMPTQINLTLSGKPTQLKAILIGDKKSGF